MGDQEITSVRRVDIQGRETPRGARRLAPLRALPRALRRRAVHRAGAPLRNLPGHRVLPRALQFAPEVLHFEHVARAHWARRRLVLRPLAARLRPAARGLRVPLRALRPDPQPVPAPHRARPHPHAPHAPRAHHPHAQRHRLAHVPLTLLRRHALQLRTGRAGAAVRALTLDAYLIRQAFFDQQQVGDTKKAGGGKGKRARAAQADNDAGQTYEWCWGTRAQCEVSEQAVAAFVAEFMVGAAPGTSRTRRRRTPRRERARASKLMWMLMGIERAAGRQLSEIKRGSMLCAPP